MILYHFTHRGHLLSILEEGKIRTTESNISIERAHAGPDVVWLFDIPEVPLTTGESLYEAKRVVRFKVNIPKQQVHKWTDWGPQKSMSPTWREAFLKAGGGMSAAGHWYVATSSIPVERWEEVTVNGAPIVF